VVVCLAVNIRVVRFAVPSEEFSPIAGVSKGEGPTC